MSIYFDDIATFMADFGMENVKVYVFFKLGIVVVGLFKLKFIKPFVCSVDSTYDTCIA